MTHHALTLPVAVLRARGPADIRKLARFGRILDRLGPDGSALFDAAWYLGQYPDVGPSGLDPLAHYVCFGGAEGRDPSPLFASAWYASRNTSGVDRLNPLVHYALQGAADGADPHPLVSSRWIREQLGSRADRQPYVGIILLHDRLVSAHPLFDPDWYLTRYPDARDSANPLLDYLDRRSHERDPHPLFSTSYYLQQRSLDEDAIPLIDYLMVHPGIDPHPLFDTCHYLSGREIPANVPALLDYVTTGWELGAQPLALFDGAWYSAAYTDSQGPELADFVRRSGDLGRRPNRVFDPRWYLGYGDLADGQLPENPSGADALAHYRRWGHARGLDPAVWFSTLWWAHRSGSSTEEALSRFLLPTGSERVDVDPVPLPPVLEAAGTPIGYADPRWGAGGSGRLQGARVYYVEDLVPSTWAGAGYPRSVRVVDELARSGAEVVVLATCQEPEDFSWDEVRAELPAEVTVLPEYRRRQVAELLRNGAAPGDLIWVSRPENMADLIEHWADWRPVRTGARLVWDTEALASRRDALRAQPGLPDGQAPAAHVPSASEMRSANAADVVVSVSAGDTAALRSAGVLNVMRIGHLVVPPPQDPGPEGRRRILFVGRLTGTDSPNVDSVRWFIEEVGPLLGRSALEALDAVGMVSDAVLAEESLVPYLRGPHSDLSPWYQRARVFIAPTRFAAGIPLKVIEAAAAGVPVVATPVVAHQLGWDPGVHLLVGSTGEQFAAQVRLLLADDELWSGLRDRALERVAAEYGPETFRAQVKSVLELARATPGAASE